MKTTTVLIGGIVVIVIIGGLIFYGTGHQDLFSTTLTPSPTTSTDTGTPTDQPAPVDQGATPSAPVAVTNSTASPTDTTAVITGRVIPNGAFTSYWYEFGTTASMGSKSSTQTVGSGSISIAAPTYLTNLTKDTTYYYRLVAQNQFGTSPGSQYSFRTSNLGTLPPVGSVPIGKTLAATGLTSTSANVTGAVTPNGAPTKYWFEYGQSSNLGQTTEFRAVGDGGVSVSASFSLANLSPATTYHFRLNAQNQFGTVNGAILTFTTTGPAAAAAPVVTTQVASPVGTTTATLRGTAHPYGSETSYWFEYSTDQNFGAPSLKSTSHKSAGKGMTTVSVEATVSGLKSKTTYYYRTVAQNSDGIVRGDALTIETK